MKAAVWGGTRKLAIKDVPVPNPAEGEVQIRTKAVGICGSDLEIYDGRYKLSKPPLILGHEGGGVIQAVGDGVTGVKKGDKVIVECLLYCGKCDYCKQGRTGLCDNSGTFGMVGAQGEYAEYFVAPEKNCHILPEGISWQEAGLIDTLACPIHSIDNLNIPSGSTVAVFGPGPAGLFFCSLAKLRGVSKTYLIGTQENRLRFGPEYGADVLININIENAVEKIRDDTGGKGVDFVIEAAGSEKAINDGFGVLKKGGSFLLYGIHGEGPVSIDIQPVQLYEFIIVGGCGVDYPASINLIKNGSIKVKDLITHTFKLEELPEAFLKGLIEKRLEDYMKGVVLF